MGFISDFKVYLFLKLKKIGNTEQHCVNYVYFIMHNEITASAEPSTVPDGSDLEGSNVHAYIALSWPIHNARLPQKTYRKQ